jgi:hypothetical protein
MNVAPTKAAIPRSHTVEFGIAQLPELGGRLLAADLIRFQIVTAGSSLPYAVQSGAMVDRARSATPLYVG